MYELEFRNNLSGRRFGECLQKSREAAEKFAIELLTELGEDETSARWAVETASSNWANASSPGYAVRIVAEHAGTDVDD
ncbi:hypothetical protein [Mycobacterium sp. pR1184]|uniref:hypothetical protein n=1 Tax=Mycobacterium sp. pR1184 TaxID=3238981 RepID=UPI00351BD807